MPTCKYYPKPGDDCVCYAGSDVSGAPTCTEDDEKLCQWAKAQALIDGT